MKIHQFLQLPFLELPFLRKDDFLDAYIDLQEEYITSLQNVEDFEIITTERPFKKVVIIKDIENSVISLKSALIKAIRSYYKGEINEAFNFFSSGLDSMYFEKNIFKRPINNNLFRMRIVENAFSISPKEIFHIPINERELVSSQRYSIPGHPCLYFSNSVYLCWLELGKPNTNKCHTSLFDCDQFSDISLLDLTDNHKNLLIESSKTNPIWNEDIKRYLLIWPLIAACSFKVLYPSRYFKPEYIIPQMLLQKIRCGINKNNNSISGLKYSSTHLNQYSKNIIGEFYNVAIPISSQCGRYCEDLTKSFKFTSPISWEQLYIDRTSETFIPNAQYNVQQIELSENNPIDYALTSFGKMEK